VARSSGAHRDREACARHGVTAGTHGNASLAARHVAAGYRMITVYHTSWRSRQARRPTSARRAGSGRLIDGPYADACQRDRAAGSATRRPALRLIDER